MIAGPGTGPASGPSVDPVGTWDVEFRTPIGRQDVLVVIARGPDGRLTGIARGAEEVPLDDVQLAGDRLTWRQSITRPLRLHLAVDVTVTGDELTGTSRAGRLPSSRVAGRRRT